ncbi:hypothetical protein [Bradyrhizobium sp. USDA 4506]
MVPTRRASLSTLSRIADINGSRNPELVRERPDADRSKSNPGNARLVQQPAERGMHIARLQLENKHAGFLLLLSAPQRKGAACRISGQ